MPHPVRLGLVEDNPTLRHRLSEHLGYHPEVQLVLLAGSGEAFLAQVRERARPLLPEVVLMDIELPGIDGIETTRQLQAQYPDVAVLMLTVYEDETKLFDSIRAGASGYLLKDTSATQIVHAVLELRQGGAPMSALMARKVLHHLRGSQPNGTPATRTPAYDLTDRELEILQLLVRGHNYVQTGEALNISPQTVRSHIKNIYKKMHVHTRADAVRIALDKRMV